LLPQRLQRAVKLLQHHQHRPVAAEQTVGYEGFAIVSPLNLDRLRWNVLTAERLEDPQRPGHLLHIGKQASLLQQTHQLRLKFIEVAEALA
jgi:hypothetical protein